MKTFKLSSIRFSTLIATLALTLQSFGQVPNLLNYQGRVTVSGVPFDGTGQFKFALVNTDGSQTYWSNAPDGNSDGEPDAPVSLAVAQGLYALQLGDSSLTNMAVLPASVFNNSDVRLRVWFNDGTNGFHDIPPNQRVTSAGYAFIAGNVSDGAITSAKLDAQFNSTLAKLNSPQTFSGTITAASFGGSGAGLTNVPGALPWQNVADTFQAAQPNTGYLANNSSRVIVTLPASPNLGDLVRVTGVGTGGWWVEPAGDQHILGRSRAGSAWTARGPTNFWKAVASSRNGVSLVAVAWQGYIYTSNDSGQSWTPRMTDVPRQWESVASSGDGSVLVAAVFNGPLYVSTNSGLSWSPRTGDKYWTAVACSSDGARMVAVEPDSTQISTDSGATWNFATGGLVLNGLAFSADGNKLVALDRVSTSRIQTANFGQVWTPRLSVSDGTLHSVACSDNGAKMVAVGSFGTTVLIYRSVDGGVTWTNQTSGIPGHVLASVASSGDGTKLVAVSPTGTPVIGYVYTSDNSGETWTLRSAESNQGWAKIASSNDGNKLLAAAWGQNLGTSEGVPTRGGQGTTVSLQYGGNRQWLSMSETDIASNVVGTLQLADGSVTSSKLSSNLSIAGTMIAGNFSGNGASLSNVNADKLDNLDSTAFATLNSSPSFNGSVTATSFTGSAANLTGLNGDNISSGTVAGARLATMTGANGVSAGSKGAVPQPAASDNTKFLRGDGTWAIAGNPGTVTSVALSAPAEFNVTGSPISSSGTIALSKANQNANLVYAGPATGAAAAPAFRSLASADIPNLDASKITSGTFTGNGSGLTGVNAATIEGQSASGFWKTTGNAGTTAGTHFLGTTEVQPVEIRSNNQRVLWMIERGITGGSPTIIGGSRSNRVENNSVGVVIAGGGFPGIHGESQHEPNIVKSNYGTVGGGLGNEAGAYASVVGGGELNTIGMLANWGAIPGGFQNTVLGEYGLAAGRRAKSNHKGSFVWADSQDADFVSTANDQFLIRAAGGVGIGRAPTAYKLEVEGDAFKTAGGAGWQTPSDRRIKTDITQVTNALERLNRVQLVSFRYDSEYLVKHPAVEDRIYHNVIAQQFQEVFPDYVKAGGEKLPNGEAILHVDVSPLTIYSAAAIQELYRATKEKDARIAALEAQVTEMKREQAAHFAALEKIVGQASRLPVFAASSRETTGQDAPLTGRLEARPTAAAQ